MISSILSTQTVSKSVPTVLLGWPITSEADVSGMAVEVELSHQYSVSFCCHVTDGSRGAIWPTWKCRWSKGVTLNSSMWKKTSSHWHSSTFSEDFWRLNSGCEDSAVVGGVFQHWWQWQWVTSVGADCYNHSMQALLHLWWKCTTGAQLVTMLKKNSVLQLRIFSIR